MKCEKVISNIKKAIKEHLDNNYAYDMLVDFELDVIDWNSLFEYIDKLQQENKQLKEELKAVRKGLNKVVSKRKKWKYRYDKEKMKNRRAKSYIKNNYHLNWYIESNYKDELLQILDKGESNE